MFSFKKPNNWSDLPLYKKISYYKMQLNDNYSKYIDKIEAKNIVKNLLKKEIAVATVIRVLEDSTDFKLEDFNDTHILKSSHGSGWNIDLNCRDIVRVKNLLIGWNKKYTLYNEIQYSYLEPRFFIEEKVTDKFMGETGNAATFMFRCIHGKAVTFSIKIFDKINSYDIDRNLLKPQELYITIPDEIFEKMKTNAEILAEQFEFVRIDFYLGKNNDIYFSEFTFTPLAGRQYFSNEIEAKLGKLWT